MNAGLFLLAVLIALVACNDAAGVPDPITGANMQQGYYWPGDILLHSGYYRRNNIYDTIQYEDVIYRGRDEVRITYFEVVEQGETQRAMPTLRAGGLATAMPPLD
ncbi:hypothetical protein PYW07_009506 [Mythimna separata]|uniref:Uncharacterized protein n=1 Tax=Mythimna separata TaxID=271217 RepID=A0AAD7YCF2_MYTSE|nr:hypothetical protein PYW07_009506 [Mythimna separata]